MKQRDSEKAAQDARQMALPVIAVGVLVAILYFGRVFFITSLIAITIAFILEPFVGLLMRARMPRGMAAFVVCTVALAILYVMALGAYTQVVAIYEDLPTYGQRIGDILDGIQQRVSATEERTKQLILPGRQRQAEQERIKQQQAEAAAAKKKSSRTPQQIVVVQAPPGGAQEEQHNTTIGDFISSRLSSLYELFLMASFIPFLVYFMLSWRDHINRSFLQFFHGEDRMVATRSLQGIADMVRAFVVGNFLLGLMLACISSAMFAMMKLPYPLLVGPLSGFLSLVPYVGLPLAMAPPLFAALGPNQVSTYVLVVVLVALLHLIALNVLYPKIVGSRVHLNPLVVTFSLMLWGFLWDAPGLLLAIPLTAGLKAVCDNVPGLRPVGKFLGD